MIEEPYPVFLYLPSRVIRKISVKKKMAIVSLKSVLPQNDMIYIFNSQILQPNMTFQDYGIIRNDVIVAISQCLSDDATKWRWLQATKDTEEITQRIQMAMSSTSSRETARLRDMRLTKLENKRKLYYHIAKKVEREQDLLGSMTSISDNCTYDCKSNNLSDKVYNFDNHNKNNRNSKNFNRIQATVLCETKADEPSSLPLPSGFHFIPRRTESAPIFPTNLLSMDDCIVKSMKINEIAPLECKKKKKIGIAKATNFN